MTRVGWLETTADALVEAVRSVIGPELDADRCRVALVIELPDGEVMLAAAMTDRRTLYERIGVEVARLRTAAGMTQRELAQRAELAQGSVTVRRFIVPEGEGSGTEPAPLIPCTQVWQQPVPGPSEASE